MKQLFTHQRLHHQGANNLLHNVFAPLRRIALLALMLCTAGGAWGQIWVKVNGGTAQKYSSISDVSTTATSIEITSGTFDENNWESFRTAKYSNLEEFIISGNTTVSSANQHNSTQNSIFGFSITETTRKPKLKHISIANMTVVPDYLFSFQGQGNLALETVVLHHTETISRGVFSVSNASQQKLHTISLPKVKNIDINAFQRCTTLTTLKLGKTPPTCHDDFFNNVSPFLSTDRWLKLIDEYGNDLTNEELETAIALYKQNSINIDEKLKWKGFFLIVPMRELKYIANTNGTLQNHKGLKADNFTIKISEGLTSPAITAVANNGYTFSHWTDSDNNELTDNPLVVANVLKDMSYTANFVVPVNTNTVSIIYSIYGYGKVYDDNNNIISTIELNKGEDGPKVTAIPDAGNIFVKWGDGYPYPKRQETDVQTTFGVSAMFAAEGAIIYSLQYTADNGTIDGYSKQTVFPGDKGLPVEAKPTSTDYIFVRWSDGHNTPNRQDSLIQDHINVTAQFIHQNNVADVCTLTYNSGTNGTINGYTPQHLIKGENGSPVTAVAKPGYKFVRWSDGRFDNPRTDTDVQGNITVTAEYTTETTQIYTLTYSADANGSITEPNPQQVAEGGDAFAVTAEPINTNYTFYRWSDGCSENPRTDKKVTENIVATAEFIPVSEATNIYKLKYVSEDNNKGTIYKGFAEQNVLYPDGCGVEVKFAGLGSYKFFRWNDFNADSTRKDCNLTSNPTEFTAYFIDRTTTTYELKYSALDGGYISGPAWQRVTTGEDGREVEAKPEDGYIFVRWSDGDTIAKRQDMNVTDHITVTAEFVPVGTPIYYVEYIAGTGGKIEPASLAKQKVPAGGNTVEIEAKGNPETDFMFTGWSDNLKTSKRSDKVTANAIYTANFTPTCCKTHWHYDTTKIAQNPCGEYTFQFPWGDTRDTVITDSETYTFTVRKDIGTGTCSAGSGIECDSLYILRVKFLPSTEHYFHVLVDDEFKYKGKTYTCSTANDTILYVFDDEYDISNCDTLKIYVHFNHPKPLSTSNVAAERINLYPNPTNTGFYIEAEAREVTVSSINGQLLHRQAISGKTYVDISHLPAGVYMVRAGSAVAKVVRI